MCFMVDNCKDGYIVKHCPLSFLKIKGKWKVDEKESKPKVYFLKNEKDLGP